MLIQNYYSTDPAYNRNFTACRQYDNSILTIYKKQQFVFYIT
jgi:hypothetical protein